MSVPSSRARDAAAFALVALIWGSTWFVIRDQISVVPPSWTVTYRFALASVAMLALALVRGESLRLDRAGQILALVVGLFQFFADFQFLYRAEIYLTSGLVAVMFALLIVPNAVFSRIFLGVPIGRRFIAGSLVAMGGIALLLLHEYRAASKGLGPDVILGVAFGLAGMMSASVANVIQAMPSVRARAIVPLIGWAMVWGTVANAAFAWVFAGPPVFDPRPLYLGGIAYLAIVGSVVTFPLYFGLIRTMGAGRAAYINVAVPVVAMALSTLFEHFRWGALAVGGAVLAMAGLLIAFSGFGKRAQP